MKRGGTTNARTYLFFVSSPASFYLAAPYRSEQDRSLLSPTVNGKLQRQGALLMGDPREAGAHQSPTFFGSPGKEAQGDGQGKILNNTGP